VKTISANEAVGLYRDALVAVLPVMERADIPLNGDQVYDPWEDIERTLYQSIIGSCVDNSPLLPLAPYGMTLRNYAGHSFLVSAKMQSAAFVQLHTGLAPFDEAVFSELGSNLVPTGKSIRRALGPVRKLPLPSEGFRADRIIPFAVEVVAREIDGVHFGV
jgi:hypothetical protein